MAVSKVSSSTSKLKTLIRGRIPLSSKTKRSRTSVPWAEVLRRLSQLPTKPSRLSSTVYDKLDDWQQRAVDWSVRVKNAGLFFEQGTGKTWITCGIVERLWSPRFIGLIVVPLANIDTTWVKLLKTHFGKHVCVTLEEFIEAKGPRILVLHYEALPGIIKKLRQIRWTLIAYDESQRLKERATLQSRTAAKLVRTADNKVILSGTPMDKEPADLWAQFRFLAPEIFGTSWKDFENEFMEDVGIDMTKYRPGSHRWRRMMIIKRIKESRRKFDMRRLPQFLERVKGYALRVTKDDALDLPKMTLVQRPVKLRGIQREIYEALEQDLVAKFESGDDTIKVKTDLRVTQIGKLQQVCGGYILDDDGDAHEVGRAKLREVKILVHRNEWPIVIFCRYLEEVWSLKRELEEWSSLIVVETLTGMRGSRNKKREKRAAIVEAFQEGKIDVLICQIRAGGVGIDLFKSHTGIFYSYTHSYIDFEQALARLHRRGQEFDVTFFLIYASSTIDEDVLSALRQKRNVSEMVLKRLKQRQ